MAQVAANVRVGVTGSVWMAASGTALPTSIAGALNAAFNDVGYISEDGVVTATSTDVTDIKAWQNGETVRKIQTSHDFTVQFSMIETNERSLQLYFGNYDNQFGNDGKVLVQSAQGFRGCFVLNVVDADDLIRIVIPDGQVTEREDISYVSGEPIGYGVTITTYPDVSGVKAYIYYKSDGAS